MVDEIVVGFEDAHFGGSGMMVMFAGTTRRFSTGFSSGQSGSSCATIGSPIGAVREHLEDSTQTDDGDLIRTHVVRVEVQADQLTVELKTPEPKQPHGRGDQTPPSRESSEPEADRTVLLVPWQKAPSKRRREIIMF